MKISDLILEAQPMGKDELRARRERSAALNKKLNTPAPAPVTPAKKLDVSTKGAASARASQVAQRFDKVKSTGPVGELAKQLKKGQKIADVWKQYGYNAVKEVADKDKNVAAKFAKWNERVGTPVRWGLRALGIGIIIYDYYTITGFIESAYQNGDIDEEHFHNAIGAANGVLTAQLGLNLVSTLKNINIIRWIIRILEAIIGIGGATFSFGASAAAALATDAFITWLTYWLGTNEGQTWLIQSWLGPFIINFGKVEASVYDSLFNYFEKQKDAKQLKQDPEAAKLTQQQRQQQQTNQQKGQEFRKELGI